MHPASARRTYGMLINDGHIFWSWASQLVIWLENSRQEYNRPERDDVSVISETWSVVRRELESSSLEVGFLSIRVMLGPADLRSPSPGARQR